MTSDLRYQAACLALLVMRAAQHVVPCMLLAPAGLGLIDSQACISLLSRVENLSAYLVVEPANHLLIALQLLLALFQLAPQILLVFLHRGLAGCK